MILSQNGRMSEDDTINVELFRQRLLDRKLELQALSESASDARAPVELDQTTQGRLSRMDAMQGQAMALETARRRQAELTRIDAALARMESGDYGYCVSCDEEISQKRLALDPAVPTCIHCADRAS